jgi:release factor glutamine methyltransferase
LILSVRETLSEGAAQLRAAGIESARLDSRVLLAKAMHVSPGEVLAHGELAREAYEKFHSLVARRAAREPLAYIIGTKEFWSLSFAVGPGVLIPRPETETLVEAALRAFGGETPLRVLDIGTGSGCLLITFLAERTNASGVGIDASEAALAWARRNAVALGVPLRCRFELADWQPSGAQAFDVVLVNPPYLTADEFEQCDPEIRCWEPRSALVAGTDGLDAIRALGPVLRYWLVREGKAFVEVGLGQTPAAAEILAHSGLDVQAVIPDLSGIARCLVAGQAGCGGR